MTTPSSSSLQDLLVQMSRGASVLNSWDAVLNIDEGLVNRIFQAGFAQTKTERWKTIAFAFCQTFPNPTGAGTIAVYTGLEIQLATPELVFLGDNQAFVQIGFKATGRIGSASKAVAEDFDPDRDCDRDDPSLDWRWDAIENVDLTGKVPMSAIRGKVEGEGPRTSFVLDFAAGSFTSPAFDRARDPGRVALQLKSYLQTNDVRYPIASIRTDLVGQIPQLAPTAFRIAVLTTNTGRNVFQIFIATDSAVPKNTTLGVNEPIPDGYDLTAMFSAGVVGALGNTLIVQTWLFLQTNLVFPGRARLSLGPSYTPEDALVLGKLAVDTSADPVTPDKPDVPAQEGPMLNIQKTQQIAMQGQPAFTAYGDDQDANAWYIPPKVVWAAQPGANVPQFALVKYERGAGAVAGLCRFTVQLIVDPAQEAALKAQIPSARLAQLDWVSANPTFTYTIDGQSTTVATASSDYGSQSATFTIELEGANAVAAFENAFSPDGSRGGVFGVSYDLTASTRLPAVTVVTKFDSTVAYQYQIEHRQALETRYHTDTWGRRHAETVSVYVGDFVHELLTQTASGTVDITPGQGLTPTLLAEVQKWANQQLQHDMEQAVGNALALMRNPGSNFSLSSVSSFTNRLTTSDVVPWYFRVDGTLPPFDGGTWQAVYSHLQEQQLDVSFELQADLHVQGIEQVNLTFQYGDDMQPVTHTFTPTGAGAWTQKLPGRLDANKDFIKTYKYKYEVVYGPAKAGGPKPAPLQTDWIESDTATVTLGLVELGLLAVTFEIANVDWVGGAAIGGGEGADDGSAKVKEITVDWSWLPGNEGPILTETLVLDGQRTSVASTLRSTRPAENQSYQYSLTFLMGNGTKLHANNIVSNQTRTRISAPLSTVSVSVLPSYPSDAKAVVVRATFDDELNGIHLAKQWQSLNKGTDTLSFETWEFETVAANLNQTTVVFSGFWVDKGGKQKVIPTTILVGTDNTIFLSDTQHQVTATIDASNISFVGPRSNGVYQMKALVSDKAQSTTVAAVDADDPLGGPLSTARTVSFEQDTPRVQYYTTDPIDIDKTPVFYFNYVYTVSEGNGDKMKVSYYWPSPQSTVSTSLPVAPGMPEGTLPVVAAAILLAEATSATPGLPERTAALLARHEAFCDRVEEEVAALRTE